MINVLYKSCYKYDYSVKNNLIRAFLSYDKKFINIYC